jgi:acyl-coenzyme A thioesterase PaaI-like protein
VAELLKLGRRLALADVRITSAAEPELIAQATVTYAIPSSPSATQRE